VSVIANNVANTASAKWPNSRSRERWKITGERCCLSQKTARKCAGCFDFFGAKRR
jgi:hypothetical protein